MRESNRRQLFLMIAAMILLAALSFGLGYLSGFSAKQTPIIIEKYSN